MDAGRAPTASAPPAERWPGAAARSNERSRLLPLPVDATRPKLAVPFLLKPAAANYGSTSFVLQVAPKPAELRSRPPSRRGRQRCEQRLSTPAFLWLLFSVLAVALALLAGGVFVTVKSLRLQQHCFDPTAAADLCSWQCTPSARFDTGAQVCEWCSSEYCVGPGAAIGADAACGDSERGAACNACLSSSGTGNAAECSDTVDWKAEYGYLRSWNRDLGLVLLILSAPFFIAAAWFAFRRLR